MCTKEKNLEQELNHVLRVCVAVGRNLLEYGAESALIRNFIERTGAIYGMAFTEISLSSSSMVVSVMKADKWATLTAKCPDRGVNMGKVMAVEKTIILAQQGRISIEEMERRIFNLDATTYNKHLVTVAIGISCAFFAKLGGGDIQVCLVTFAAATVGKTVLRELQHRAFSPVACFFFAALVCTCLSGLALKFNIGADPSIAVHSSVLLFVPGFPLVNALSDMVKGFKNMGVARWISASLITLATALGMICAMNILGI